PPAACLSDRPQRIRRSGGGDVQHGADGCTQDVSLPTVSWRGYRVSGVPEAPTPSMEPSDARRTWACRPITVVVPASANSGSAPVSEPSRFRMVKFPASALVCALVSSTYLPHISEHTVLETF